jgi:hypothetical protein
MATGSWDIEKFHEKVENGNRFMGHRKIFIKKLKMATGSWDIEKFHEKVENGNKFMGLRKSFTKIWT